MARTRNTILGAGSLILVGVLAWFLRPASAPAPQEPTSPPLTPPTRHIRNDADQFVGSHACTTCHAEIAKSYASSGMSHSWQHIATHPEVSLPDGQVDDTRSGYRYDITCTPGEVVQREFRSDGPHSLQVEGHYWVGSGKHARAAVQFHNGFLHLLPAAYFTAQQGWKLNPGYEARNHRFDRPVLHGCVACHAGAGVAEPEPTPNRYRQLPEQGISCERCHGPARDHVEYWQEPASRPASTLLSLAKLPAARKNDICLQCHLQGDVSLSVNDNDIFAFRPGDRLADFRLDFLAKTEHAESFGVASHGGRMLQSKCYTGSKGDLTCVHCHDPHQPAAKQTTAHYDSRCIACHQPQACSREADTTARSRPEGCVRCHMPQRPTREGQHLIFTDHGMPRKPVPPGSPELKPNSDVELIAVWPEADPLKLRLGSAYIALHEQMGPQTRALARGLDILRQQNALDPEASFWLGTGLAAAGRQAEAATLLRALVQEQPQLHRARYRLAITLDQLQHYDAAITEYEKILQIAPNWPEPHELLARLYLYRQRFHDTIRILEKQLQLRPDATALARLALAQQQAGTPIPECLKRIDEAIQLDPRIPLAYLHQAHLLTVAGQLPQAERSYRKVLEIEPGNAIALAGLRSLEPHLRK